MAQKLPEAKDRHSYRQWTQEERMRLSAALDLYLHYLIKNYGLPELPDTTSLLARKVSILLLPEAPSPAARPDPAPAENAQTDSTAAS